MVQTKHESQGETDGCRPSTQRCQENAPSETGHEKEKMKTAKTTQTRDDWKHVVDRRILNLR